MRIFRTLKRPDGIAVQYGCWITRNIERRFYVFREWPAESAAHAEQLTRKLQVDVLLDPELRPAPDEKPTLELGWHIADNEGGVKAG